MNVVRIKPSTTVVVLPATVYIVYAVPAEAGSAAKVTTLNVLAIYPPKISLYTTPEQLQELWGPLLLCVEFHLNLIHHNIMFHQNNHL